MSISPATVNNHLKLKPERPRLLVVDDDSSVRLVSRKALEKVGFLVYEASDGETALDWLQSGDCDAVLLDARMPGLTGFETCQKMRVQMGADPIPIIIATALEDDDSIQKAFESGATDYAPKPLDWRIIIPRLQALMRACEAIKTGREMYDLAHTDSETGLANERRLVSELAPRLNTLRAPAHRTVLIRCASPDFYHFNAKLCSSGLKKLALDVVNRFQACVGEYLAGSPAALRLRPLYARLSESHFCIALTGCHSDEMIRQLAESLLRALSVCTEIDDICCNLKWTIGIAGSDQLASTDALMGATAFAIKQDPKNTDCPTICFYNASLREAISRGVQLENFLRRDITEGKLEVHYQPKFALSDYSLVGMEALIRWNSGELGQVSPARFIPIAESVGLIIPLSHLVIERVLDQMVCWQQQGLPAVPVSINVSGIHLNSATFVQELVTAVSRRRVPSHLVELEVTESVMVQGSGVALCNLNELRALGFRISVDDFGTGYSSFSYLQDLPIDCLKVDRSFINSIASDATARAIARAIITVGHDVGLHVIAEGVESPEQLRCLKALKCDSVQGYLTGRPVHGDDFSPFFSGYRATSTIA